MLQGAPFLGDLCKCYYNNADLSRPRGNKQNVEVCNFCEFLEKIFVIRNFVI